MCDVCCANDVNNNIKEAQKSIRGDGETSQCVAVVGSSPTQLNAN